MAEASAKQYLRTMTLVVSTLNGESLDLSQLHVKFATKRSDTMTPNSADIRVYNLKDETASRIRNEFTTVTLQAGYQGNYGVIFQGNIKQVILGRESSTDTFVDLICGDGDRAYNFSIVNTSLAKGATIQDQIQAAAEPMSDKGVTQGTITADNTSRLPRGKVMYGNSRDYLRDAAISTNSNWSIQNEKINFIPTKSPLPGEAVVLTSKTGVIGTPQQTDQGVNLKCLLNPRIQIAGLVQIDNKAVALMKIDLTKPGSPANTPPLLTTDGIYYVLIVEHAGDNRSTDWYSNIICISQDPTKNARNSVGGFF